jgi:hypothetical protein
MLGFDGEGRLDREAFMRQNLALWNIVASRVLGRLVEEETTVVDASSHFVVRGGQWQPSPELKRRIPRAALDELKCERL